MTKDTISTTTPSQAARLPMMSMLTSRWFILIVLLVTAFAFGLFMMTRQLQPAPKSDAMPVNPLIEEQLGIRVTQVALSGDSGLIDFRYQVLDPDKAERIMSEPENYPSLLAEESQIPIKYSLYMPHHEDIVAGRTYYLLFYNSDGVVQQGDFVTVVFGDLKFEHIPVK